MLGRWVKEHQSDDDKAFRGNGRLSSEQEEIRRLKNEVKRLTMGSWLFRAILSRHAAGIPRDAGIFSN